MDVQNDFISGSLRLDHCPAKEDAEEVVPIINQLIEDGSFNILAYTYDWHPADHCSYLSNIKHHSASVHSSVNIDQLNLFDLVTLTKPVELKQVMWPDHCVQNSWGAELHKDLRVRYIRYLILLPITMFSMYLTMCKIGQIHSFLYVFVQNCLIIQTQIAYVQYVFGNPTFLKGKRSKISKSLNFKF